MRALPVLSAAFLVIALPAGALGVLYFPTVGAGSEWRLGCEGVAAVAWTIDSTQTASFTSAGECGARLAQPLDCRDLGDVGDEYHCYGTTPDGHSLRLWWDTIVLIFGFEETDASGSYVDEIYGAWA